MNRNYSRYGHLWIGAVALLLSFSTSVQSMPMVALTQDAPVAGVYPPPNKLLSFDSDTPGTIFRTVTITGLQSGERIVAIDVRSSTGQLYGIAAADNFIMGLYLGSLYMISPATGVATRVGTTTYGLAGGLFAMDFNPVTDELRVMAGLNMRINPDTGQIIDADPVTLGTQTDSIIYVENSIAFPDIAYSNNFSGATVTSLYGRNFYDGRFYRIEDVKGNPSLLDNWRLSPIGESIPMGGPLPEGASYYEDIDIASTGEAFIMYGGAIFGANLTVGAVLSGKPIGTTPLQVTGLAVTPIQPGWWWNPNESGRGFSIEVSQNTLFMAGYLYDTSGRATWHTSAGPMTNSTLYQGPLQSFGNGQTLTGAYKPYSLTSPNAGTITIQFSDATHGALTWPGGTIPIERYVFGEGASSFQPESGWWWNQSESGRGFALEVQGNKLFIGGYMYDEQGNPVWYISAGDMTSPMLYQGQWEQYANGQTLTGLYRKPTQVNGNVGSITLQFTGRATAVLTLPDGRQVNLTRYRF